MQLGAGGGVLQVDALVGKDVGRGREGGERGLVEAREDQLLLAGIGVDVADREDAGLAGLELLGVDLERLLLELEAPLRDRPELRVQPEECEQLLAADALARAVGPPRPAPSCARPRPVPRGTPRAGARASRASPCPRSRAPSRAPSRRRPGSRARGRGSPRRAARGSARRCPRARRPPRRRAAAAGTSRRRPR